jgi:hypothetical protein
VNEEKTVENTNEKKEEINKSDFFKCKTKQMFYSSKKDQCAERKQYLIHKKQKGNLSGNTKLVLGGANEANLLNKLTENSLSFLKQNMEKSLQTDSNDSDHNKSTIRLEDQGHSSRVTPITAFHAKNRIECQKHAESDKPPKPRPFKYPLRKHFHGKQENSYSESNSLVKEFTFPKNLKSQRSKSKSNTHQTAPAVNPALVKAIEGEKQKISSMVEIQENYYGDEEEEEAGLFPLDLDLQTANDYTVKENLFGGKYLESNTAAPPFHPSSTLYQNHTVYDPSSNTHSSITFPPQPLPTTIAHSDSNPSTTAKFHNHKYPHPAKWIAEAKAISKWNSLISQNHKTKQIKHNIQQLQNKLKNTYYYNSNHSISSAKRNSSSKPKCVSKKSKLSPQESILQTLKNVLGRKNSGFLSEKAKESYLDYEIEEDFDFKEVKSKEESNKLFCILSHKNNEFPDINRNTFIHAMQASNIHPLSKNLHKKSASHVCQQVLLNSSVTERDKSSPQVDFQGQTSTAIQNMTNLDASQNKSFAKYPQTERKRNTSSHWNSSQYRSNSDAFSSANIKHYKYKSNPNQAKINKTTWVSQFTKRKLMV